MKRHKTEDNFRSLSILLGSINPYSHFGHSQRMFSLAHQFAKRGIRVTWLNPPSFSFFNSTKFIVNASISKRSGPLPFSSLDIVEDDIVISLYNFWALPKYDKLNVSLIGTRILTKFYSKLISRIQKFDAFIFDSPIFVDFAISLKRFQNTLTIYHSPDDYIAYSELSKSFKSLERDVVKTSDIIIVPTESLRERISTRYKNRCDDILVIPNGVPEDMIASHLNYTKAEEKPRIGFIGTLASWIDMETILNVASKMKGWEFVIVGDGSMYNFWKLRAPSNCKFLGRISIAKKSEVISSFDVSLIPFKKTQFTDSAFPLKLLEYFARGIPVVSTPLVEVKNIAGSLVYFADTIDKWVEQINNALTESFNSKLSYVEFASKYTWERAAESYLKIISEKEDA